MEILNAKIAIAAYLVFLLYWFAFRSQRLDRFRQDLFTLRDSLFDAALGNGKNFDNPAYLELRSSINGIIRYADHLSPLSLVFTWFSTPDKLKTVGNPIQNEPEHASYRETRSRVRSRVLRYVFVEHLIFGPIVFAILAAFAVLTAGTNRILDVVLQPIFSRAKNLGDESAFSNMLMSP